MGSDDAKAVAARALGLLDLTSLGDGETEDDIRRLCANAATRHGDVAAVCVWPRFAGLASELLDGSGIRVAAVANFPDGSADTDRAAGESAGIIGDGGDEVDVVFPYAAFLAGDEDTPARLVASCRKACGDARLKVILETGLMPGEAEIRRASRIALDNGADFIKTSTGMARVSASPDAARAMLGELADSEPGSGLKVSGGIRDTATAGLYLGLADGIMGPGWVSADTFRIGASGLLDDLLAVLDGEPAAQAGTGY